MLILHVVLKGVKIRYNAYNNSVSKRRKNILFNIFFNYGNNLLKSMAFSETFLNIIHRVLGILVYGFMYDDAKV